jgi:hypothetical protein
MRVLIAGAGIGVFHENPDYNQVYSHNLAPG